MTTATLVIPSLYRVQDSLPTDTSCTLSGSIITAGTPCSIVAGDLAPATFIVGNVAPGVYTVTAIGTPKPRPIPTLRNGELSGLASPSYGPDLDDSPT